MSVNKFYAVKVGRKTGIYNSWEDCKVQVLGYPKAVFKSFKTKREADDFCNITQNYHRPPVILAPRAEKRNLPPTNMRDDIIKRRYESVEKRNREFINHSSNIVDQEIIRRLREIFDSPNYVRPVYSSEKRLSYAMEQRASAYFSLSYDINDRDRMVVFTRGYCKLSPEYQAIAGFGVFWGFKCFLNDGEKYLGIQDLNHSDIAAVIRAIEVAHKCGMKKLLIKTESDCRLMCMTPWINGWNERNWETMDNTAVKCREMVEKVGDLIVSTGIDIKWGHVKNNHRELGHAEAERLASHGAYKWLQL